MNIRVNEDLPEPVVAVERLVEIVGERLAR